MEEEAVVEEAVEEEEEAVNERPTRKESVSGPQLGFALLRPLARQFHLHQRTASKCHHLPCHRIVAFASSLPPSSRRAPVQQGMPASRRPPYPQCLYSTVEWNPDANPHSNWAFLFIELLV